MSSILKALKKLEAQSSDNKEKHTWPDATGSAQKTFRKRSHRRSVVVFIIIVIFFSFAGSFYFFKNKSPQEKQPAAFPEKADTKSNTVKAIIPLPESFKQDIETVKKPPSKPIKVSEIKNLRPPGMTSKPFIPKSASEKPKNIIQQKNDTQKTVSEKKNPPKLETDSRVDIQAIVWSSEPAQRFAVINNSIVREGESIDNISVLDIEENIIRFRENGKEWRQQFTIR